MCEKLFGCGVGVRVTRRHLNHTRDTILSDREIYKREGERKRKRNEKRERKMERIREEGTRHEH